VKLNAEPTPGRLSTQMRRRARRRGLCRWPVRGEALSFLSIAVRLVEAVEEHRQLLGGNAVAGVDDAEAHELAVALGGAVDRAAFGRELEGVAQEIAQHLEHAARIGAHEQESPIGLRQCRRTPRRAASSSTDSTASWSKLAPSIGWFPGEAVGLEAHGLLQVVDEADQALGVGEHGPQGLLDFLGLTFSFVR